MRVRSSLKWTALTGVSPGTIGSSVKGLDGLGVAVTPNAWVAVMFDPLVSVAVTVTVTVTVAFLPPPA